MRVIFAGTPEFAATALMRLCAEGFAIPLVLTQPDRPAGRGMKLHESPVKAFARAQGLALAQPRSLRLDGRFPHDAQAARERIADAHADALVVAAYGLILPQWVLDLMHRKSCPNALGWGCLNIHASLLPRWRGAAPIQRAIEAGDTQTGVTIMQMDAGLDTGDMLLAQALPIRHSGPDADTSGSLHDRLAILGADMVVSVLRQLGDAALIARKQPLAGVCYAHKVEKTHAEVDWTASAELVERRIRAFNPAPGAWTVLAGAVVKLWRSEVCTLEAEHGAPGGTILGTDRGAIEVACGTGVLRLCELQRSGGKPMDAAAFLRGHALQPGMQFGLRAD